MTDSHEKDQDIAIAIIKQEQKTMSEKLDDLTCIVKSGFEEQKLDLKAKTKATNLAISVQNEKMERNLKEQCDKMETDFVKKEEFNNVRIIVYGAISIIVVTVFSALVYSVIKQ